ncbi:MAG: hypothetical protein M3308_05450, partial [Actinomycetota bacterium]|nr:hypothetical protein [Actinomycetota bacterium]
VVRDAEPAGRTAGVRRDLRLRLAAVAAFTVLQAVVSSGFRLRPGTAPRKVVMLGTALNIASVGLGVSAATLTGLVLDSSVTWPLGAFLAAFAFVLAEALELTLAARVERRFGDREAETESE